MGAPGLCGLCGPKRDTMGGNGGLGGAGNRWSVPPLNFGDPLSRGEWWPSTRDACGGGESKCRGSEVRSRVCLVGKMRVSHSPAWRRWGERPSVGRRPALCSSVRRGFLGRGARRGLSLHCASAPRLVNTGRVPSGSDLLFCKEQRGCVSAAVLTGGRRGGEPWMEKRMAAMMAFLRTPLD